MDDMAQYILNKYTKEYSDLQKRYIDEYQVKEIEIDHTKVYINWRSWTDNNEYSELYESLRYSIERDLSSMTLVTPLGKMVKVKKQMLMIYSDKIYISRCPKWYYIPIRVEIADIYLIKDEEAMQFSTSIKKKVRKEKELLNLRNLIDKWIIWKDDILSII